MRFFRAEPQRTRRYQVAAYQLRLETACQLAKALGYSVDDITTILGTNDNQNKGIRKKLMSLTNNILYSLDILSISKNIDDPINHLPNQPKVDMVKIQSTQNLSSLWPRIRAEAENIRGQAALEDRSLLGKVISFFLPKTEYINLGEVRRHLLLGKSLDIAGTDYARWKHYLDETLADKPGYLTRVARDIWNPRQQSFIATARDFFITSIAVSPLVALFIYEERLKEVLSPVFKAMRVAGNGLFQIGTGMLQVASLVPFTVFQATNLPLAMIKGFWNGGAGADLWAKFKDRCASALQGAKAQIDLCLNQPANNSWGKFLLELKDSVGIFLKNNRSLAMIAGLALVATTLPLVGAGLGSVFGSLLPVGIITAISNVTSLALGLATASVGLVTLTEYLPKLVKLGGALVSFIPFSLYETIAIPIAAVIGMGRGLLGGVGITGKLSGIFTEAIQGIKDQVDSCCNPANAGIGSAFYRFSSGVNLKFSQRVDNICNWYSQILTDGHNEAEVWRTRIDPTIADIQANAVLANQDLKMRENEIMGVLEKLAGRAPMPEVGAVSYNWCPEKRQAADNLVLRTAPGPNGDNRPIFIQKIVESYRDQAEHRRDFAFNNDNLNNPNPIRPLYVTSKQR